MTHDRLHPLHTVEFVRSHLLSTGYYPGDRNTGRTTAIALESIAKALLKPHSWVTVRDHHNSEAADDHLVHTIRKVVSTLGLRYFEVDRQPAGWQIKFGN